MAPAAQAGGLSDTAAAAIAYITIIPAIVFLVMEPYNKKPLVRFHAFQSLFLGVGTIAASIVLTIIPILGWMLLPFLNLAWLAVTVFCILKASKGEKFKLPIIGDLAEKQANS